MIAVIETGGNQYLVKEGKKIIIKKTGLKEGEKIVFDKVLLLFDEKNNRLFLGKPYLDNTQVEGSILKNIKEKILIIKFKPKTRYRKKKGYKNYFDEVLIEKITSSAL